MTTRERVLTVLLGITGIVAAGAITLAANSISGHEIGLSAQPVSIAPIQAPPKPAPGPEADDRDEDRGSDDDDPRASDSSSGPGPSSGSDEDFEQPEEEDRSGPGS